MADTGDIEAIARHRPQDATTNRSLLYHAAQMHLTSCGRQMLHRHKRITAMFERINNQWQFK